MKKNVAAALLLIIALTTPAFGDDLAIGLGADVTSIDPHHTNLGPNNAIAEQIFDALVRRDARLNLIPGLAERWRPVDDLTWEFQLRKGVKFHDGSDFTAADVVFSLDRPRWLSGVKDFKGVGGFLTYTQAITEKIVVDPHTIRLRTAAPYPYLPADLMGVAIVSSKVARDAHSNDFDSGKATIGTGPLKFIRFARGDRIELARNDTYWGAKSPWEKVTLRLITSDAARTAALLAGDVRLIESVPIADYPKLKANPNINVSMTTSSRLVHLQLDSSREKSPFVTEKADRSGRLAKPLDTNPLRDIRVRRAISQAINREAIVARVMDEMATSAGQMMPEGFVGASPNLKPDRYDPDNARKLLAQAGYPHGFGLTLHGPNNRLINDEQILQAIAQMLERVGISARIEPMPYSMYITRARNLEFSVVLQSWQAISESTLPLRFVAASFDRNKGLGAFNFGRYSNPKADALLEQALATINDARRQKLLQEATELVIRDYGIIPLHFQMNTWATRKPLYYEARADERTYAHEVSPGK